MKFSKGNRKLPKTTLIWNLPAVETCPKATTKCKEWCYAKKAERIYPNVLPFRRDNLWYSTLRTFTMGTINKIQNHLDRDKIKPEQIRIHESGDFYNQEYVDNWIVISKHFPQIIFYAYTKSWHLDFSKRPKNFILILSDDEKNITKHWDKFDGIASVMEEKKFLPQQNEFACLMDCKICKYCYTKSKAFKRVLFPKH